MKVCTVLLVSFTIFAQSWGDEETSPGLCPTAVLQPNFEEDKFNGTWYETNRFVNTLVTGDCTVSTYTWNTTAIKYAVTSSTKDLTDSSDIKKSEIKFELRRITGNNVTGKYVVYKDEKLEKQLFMVQTDYTNYAIAWGCWFKDGNNTQRLFLYSRKRTMEKQYYDQAIAVLKTMNVTTNNLKAVEQDEKKCNSGTLAFPSIIMGITALLIIKLFH